jgi:hypothetical protein
MLDCSVRGVLCGEVCWTAVCVAFGVERYAGIPVYLSTQNATHTHQTLCCHITTIDIYIFKKTFKSSDFKKEPASSLKMI